MLTERRATDYLQRAVTLSEANSVLFKDLLGHRRRGCPRAHVGGFLLGLLCTRVGKVGGASGHANLTLVSSLAARADSALPLLSYCSFLLNFHVRDSIATTSQLTR